MLDLNRTDEIVVRIDERCYGDFNILNTEREMLNALSSGADVRVVSRALLDKFQRDSGRWDTERKQFELKLKSAPRLIARLVTDT